jgi:hypothetical protein
MIENDTATALEDLSTATPTEEGDTIEEDTEATTGDLETIINIVLQHREVILLLSSYRTETAATELLRAVEDTRKMESKSRKFILLTHSASYSLLTRFSYSQDHAQLFR